MAKTSKYGFEYRKNLIPNVETPATLEVIISNSAAALTIGDAVQYTGGYLMGSAADAAKLGILVGFVTKNGENIFKTNEALGGVVSGDDTYNAASDNVTVDQVKGVVVVDPMALFFAYSTGTITQAMVGEWFLGAVSDGTYVDSVNYTTAQGAWSVGTQDFQLIELVSSTSGLFRIGRSQLLNDVTA